MNARNPVLDVALAQMTHSREARHYLSRFRADDALRFAVIKVGGGIIDSDCEALATALATLAQLGLLPVVLHGAGVQIDRALAEAGVETRRVNGLRVTDAATMAVLRPTVYAVNRTLVRALEQQGVRAQGIVHGVFECELQDAATLGLVGEVKRVHLDAIREAAHQGVVPVLTCLGETPGGQVINVNADVVTRELVWASSPDKVIFLTPTGGVLDARGERLSAIQLNHDMARLMRADWLHSGMRLKIQQIDELLRPMGPGHSVSITSPEQLVRELFTHQGAGTYITRGEAIHRHDRLDAAAMNNLTAVFEGSFQRRFAPNFLQQLPLLGAHVADSGRAAALVTDTPFGPFLHKFAVTPAAQGEGLAAALWQSLREHHPTLHWRSRAGNPINAWYLKQADCALRSEDAQRRWIGFACGLPLERAQAALQAAFNQPTGWLSERDDATLTEPGEHTC